MDKTKEKYVDFFANDGLDNNLPFVFKYEGDLVDDSIPEEEEIRRALFRMRNCKAPGLSAIAVEHLNAWYREAHPKNSDEKEVADEIHLVNTDEEEGNTNEEEMTEEITIEE